MPRRLKEILEKYNINTTYKKGTSNAARSCQIQGQESVAVGQFQCIAFIIWVVVNPIQFKISPYGKLVPSINSFTHFNLLFSIYGRGSLLQLY